MDGCGWAATSSRASTGLAAHSTTGSRRAFSRSLSSKPAKVRRAQCCSKNMGGGTAARGPAFDRPRTSMRAGLPDLPGPARAACGSPSSRWRGGHEGSGSACRRFSCSGEAAGERWTPPGLRIGPKSPPLALPYYPRPGLGRAWRASSGPACIQAVPGSRLGGPTAARNGAAARRPGVRLWPAYQVHRTGGSPASIRILLP